MGRLSRPQYNFTERSLGGSATTVTAKQDIDGEIDAIIS